MKKIDNRVSLNEYEEKILKELLELNLNLFYDQFMVECQTNDIDFKKRSLKEDADFFFWKASPELKENTYYKALYLLKELKEIEST